jgi:aarF domain-containing kinase
MGIDRKKLSLDVTKLLNRMIFGYGFVHADPHTGNIKVRVKPGTKNEGQIILLDHGLYQVLS